MAFINKIRGIYASQGYNLPTQAFGFAQYAGTLFFPGDTVALKGAATGLREAIPEDKRKDITGHALVYCTYIAMCALLLHKTLDNALAFSAPLEVKKPEYSAIIRHLVYVIYFMNETEPRQEQNSLADERMNQFMQEVIARIEHNSMSCKAAIAQSAAETRESLNQLAGAMHNQIQQQGDATVAATESMLGAVMQSISTINASIVRFDTCLASGVTGLTAGVTGLTADMSSVTAGVSKMNTKIDAVQAAIAEQDEEFDEIKEDLIALRSESTGITSAIAKLAVTKNTSDKQFEFKAVPQKKLAVKRASVVDAQGHEDTRVCVEGIVTEEKLMETTA